MKCLLLLLVIFHQSMVSQNWIRINQLGYTPQSVKSAVFVSKEPQKSISSFTVRTALTDSVVLISNKVVAYGPYAAFQSTFRLDFTPLSINGSYYLQVDSVRSPVFRVSPHVYDGSSDFLLHYLRQQRCGYNPYLNDSCHTHDGFVIYHPTLDSTFIDVVGGWHDASDYLQYVTTSSTAVFQMLMAYQLHPHAFGDSFSADGTSGANGIPDILDEAKWGLDWLVKMNPAKDSMFNQIADDRDHRGFRLPTEDTVNYGKGKERPVYYVNGKPQGIYQYKNRTTGVASTAAKFASSFALASTLLRKYYPVFAVSLEQKAFDAYEFGKQYPGVCQTAPCGAPYFYEEDNWTDDMELAAVQLYLLHNNTQYLRDAASFGAREKITPWFGADTARHYQWYPFVNLGHASLAAHQQTSDEFIGYLRSGISKVYEKGVTNAFLFGIPFIWCSNNLVSSFLTQVMLYKSLTNDSQFDQMEASLRDWLFGCNIWGKSMVFGLPRWGDTPVDPHSAFTHVYNYPINGGLVDGPVRASIFEQHKKYIRLTKPDPYSEFQSDLAIYHDDWGDYTNNEPTMDGTAGLTMYLSSLESKIGNNGGKIYSSGGIVRMDTSKKEIYLVFTGHEFADGGQVILATLRKHAIKGSFFFTGDFYRNQKHKDLIAQLKNEGHYLGAHSDKHVLYASWEKRDSLLIDNNIFVQDLKNNYKEMAKFGILPSDARYFLPPYEWYNQSISDWTNELGLSLINFTSGTSSNADYTTPDMSNYVSSDSIISRIVRYEASQHKGLNGFIFLSHIGTDSRRTDKFYDKLDGVLSMLKKKGYSFKSL